ERQQQRLLPGQRRLLARMAARCGPAAFPGLRGPYDYPAPAAPRVQPAALPAERHAHRRRIEGDHLAQRGRPRDDRRAMEPASRALPRSLSVGSRDGAQRPAGASRQGQQLPAAVQCPSRAHLIHHAGISVRQVLVDGAGHGAAGGSLQAAPSSGRHAISPSGPLAGAVAGERLPMSERSTSVPLPPASAPVKRRHRMPFGAELTSDGRVRFRLWAPSARSVDLVLQGGPTLPMPSAGDGWYELVTPEARTGTRYRYRIDGKLDVPDPASRFNPEDVSGASQVIDPEAFPWDDSDWRAPPWHEAAVYELHVGTFSEEGTFAGAARKLDYLLELGISVIELMPVADFPGHRGWGYDGVLPYAPESAYGTPQDLKALVAAAHRRGIAVMLDVVYNHF